MYMPYYGFGNGHTYNFTIVCISIIIYMHISTDFRSSENRFYVDKTSCKLVQILA